jgi:serine/threonine protein kinase
MIAQRIGPYEITARLGEGGMGVVYRARDTRLGRDVALKVLPDLFAADPERLARFDREARTLAALNHPHIAQVYGVEQAGSTSAIVMEMVDGDDLADRIARGLLPLDEALAMARQIADALGAAHDKGIVHRDLKPANVKITAEGDVKVLDFGLAKAFDAGDSTGAGAAAAISPTITSPAVTQRGVILGTAFYMSPEQARGKPVDARADLWAFGCVLFEMLSGVRPFGPAAAPPSPGVEPPEEGPAIVDVLGAVIHKEPAWDALPASTPAMVRTVLRWCLTKDPRQRIRNAQAVQLALAGPFDVQQHLHSHQHSHQHPHQHQHQHQHQHSYQRHLVRARPPSPGPPHSSPSPPPPSGFRSPRTRRSRA